MSIAKGYFPGRALFLLTAAILLTAMPPRRLLRAGTTAEAGPAAEAAAAELALDARDLDATAPAAAGKELEALVAEAAAGSGEAQLALEALNEVDVDAEEKALPGTTGAEAAEKEQPAGDNGGKAQDRLEREAGRDEKEIGAIEKEAEGTVEPGEDDKGDAIEREDPGMDD